jgi:tRNA pseudouridine55 synthase
MVETREQETGNGEKATYPKNMTNNFGFLNLNKPAGWTSHDCVAKVRKLLKIKQVGHGGTLDPAATGVLPIAVGKATRLLQFLPAKKAYSARIRFGVRTTTDDLEGEIIQTQSAEHLNIEQVQSFLTEFIGIIEQVPPTYSAIQKDGKRLYELARKGQIVEVLPRQVNIEKIEYLAWYPGEYPELEVNILCGTGTYIRSIARDLGEKLQVGGTLANLIRTESCGMSLSNSLTLEDIENKMIQAQLSLISPQIALKNLSTISLSDSDAQRYCQGQKITLTATEGLNNKTFVTVQHQQGLFLGMGQIIIKNVTYDRDMILVPKVVLT